MTRITVLTAAAVAFLVGGHEAARADYYGAPWCAVVSMGDGDVHWSCEYRSIEECRPNVLAGNRGWCNPNPYWVAAQSAAPGHSRKVRTRPQQ